MLRNLVSNALKFSPRNGTIVIAAYFRPDAGAPAPTAVTGTDEKKGDDVEACGSGRGPSAASPTPLAIDGSLVIEVIDHGVGVPLVATTAIRNGLGGQLSEMLAKLLGGSLRSASAKPGLRWTLKLGPVISRAKA